MLKGSKNETPESGGSVKLDPPYNQPWRCQWNWETARCWMAGVLSSNTRGVEVGKGLSARIVKEPGYCRFHWDCLHAHAHDNVESYSEWMTRHLPQFMRYPTTDWTRYMPETIWEAIRGRQQLPQIQGTEYNRGGPEAPPEMVKDYLDVIHRMLHSDKPNPGDGSWGREAISWLHAKQGCPVGCRMNHA